MPEGYHESKDCPVLGYGRGSCNKCLPAAKPKKRPLVEDIGDAGPAVPPVPNSLLD